MVRKQNALDWYHETVCSTCDLPNDKCPMGSTKEQSCILAAILRAIRENE